MVTISLNRTLSGLLIAIVATVFTLVYFLLLADSPPPTEPSASLMSTQRPAATSDSAQTRERLTRQQWQRVEEAEEGLAAETTAWTFYTDGTFRRRFTADYQEAQAGAWSLSFALEQSGMAEVGGVIFLAYARPVQDSPFQVSVLSFQFRDDRLRLGENVYQPVSPKSDEPPPQIAASIHEAVSAHEQSQFFSLWSTITATSWQAASDPSPGDPTSVSFARDGTYTAAFTTTQCEIEGTWSLLRIDGNGGELRYSVPANECDPRGPRDAFVRALPLTLSDTRLFLYETKYVRSEKGGEPACTRTRTDK